jgi:hypothetical protein
VSTEYYNYTIIAGISFVVVVFVPPVSPKSDISLMPLYVTEYSSTRVGDYLDLMT